MLLMIHKESEDDKIKDWLIQIVEDYEWEYPESKDKALDWLEKQGKQPITIRVPDGCRAYIKDRIIYIENYNQPYKVKPKFKTGDWITNGLCSFQITSMDDEYYWSHGDTLGGDIESIDEQYHLWTINDAKDGDVLIVNNEIFIYAHRKQMYPIAVAHCFVDSAGGFHLDGEFGYIEKGNSISPATKEQRDKLFKAMEETGYEWKAETKEPIKVSKLKEPTGVLKHLLDEEKSWSEEDERMLVDCFNIFHRSDYATDKVTKTVNWLKSLKQRIVG